MDKTIRIIKEKITKAFGEKRIISLLFFGTRAFEININKFSDYDLVLMLDDYKNRDLFKLKMILDSPPLKEKDINLSLVYKSDVEVRGINNFQLRTLKLDIYKYLSGARVLIGNNYFKENPVTMTSVDLKEYANFKIQEFYGRCDKLYMECIPLLELTNKIKKYTREMLRSILISEGKLSFLGIKNIKYKNMYKMAISEKYINSKDANNLTSDNLNLIEVTRRNIYLKYLDLFYEKIN